MNDVEDERRRTREGTKIDTNRFIKGSESNEKGRETTVRRT